MKANKYIRTIAAIAIVATASACDENSWNDHLDGFDKIEDKEPSQVETVEYTLTDANYGQIVTLNSGAVSGDDLDALKAVGDLKRFSAEAPASKYVPAFLASTNFPYFALSNGSAVVLTYNVAENEPADYTDAQKAQQYTLSDDDYIDLWGENYILALAPSLPASTTLPSLLIDNLDPEEGRVCVVNYKMATQEPVFGAVPGDDDDAFKPTSVIATLSTGDAGVTIRGVVMGICGQGYIVADKSGAIFVYMGSGFDTGSVALGDQLEIKGDIGAYNRGLQVTGSSASVQVVGTQSVTYPSAKVYTGAELDEAITRTGDAAAIYATVKGEVTVTDRNINIKPEGAATAQGSVYGITDDIRALFTNGATQTITGYFIAIAGSRYCNFVVTAVDGTALSAPKRHAAARSTVDVPTETLNAVFFFDGNRWTTNSSFSVLNPSDYRAMGQKYDNLTEPGDYLTRYLTVNYPYAQQGDIRYVMWYKYVKDNSHYVCSAFRFDGANWSDYNFTTVETSQFVRAEGKWMYDPNVTITLPAGKGVEISTLYYQTCVDWVFENICKPLGDTSIKSGLFYVTTYGNNEYYSGTSAFQGNVDLRPSSARAQYGAEYDSMTDEQIVELLKTRFMKETMPGALAILHSDAAPVEGMDVLYTINFYAYDGSSTTPYTAVFKVVSKGKFEPVSCTWWAE